MENQEQERGGCLKLGTVIFGTLCIVASVFIIYLAVAPFERQLQGEPDLPLLSPNEWSIFATLLSVILLLLGGSCLVCGFFGGPGVPESYEGVENDEMYYASALALLEAAMLRAAERSEDNSESNSSDDEEEEV